MKQIILSMRLMQKNIYFHRFEKVQVPPSLFLVVYHSAETL